MTDPKPPRKPEPSPAQVPVPPQPRPDRDLPVPDFEPFDRPEPEHRIEKVEPDLPWDR